MPSSQTLAVTLGVILTGVAAVAGVARDRHIERQLFESTPEGSHYRAGDPLLVAPRAQPTYTPAYEAGYVGGGVPAFGRGRGPTPDEGTWGRDYVGHRFLRQVWLRWSGGRRYQAGGGTYKTDGPKLIE